MPDAISERISQAVCKIIGTLGLTPPPSVVAKRKRPCKLDGDKLPMVTVSVGDEEKIERIGTSRTRGLLTYAVQRPVTIGLAFASGGGIADNPNLRIYRDSIWPSVTLLTLQKTGFFDSSGSPNDVFPNPQPIFDAAALRDSNVDWSLISLIAETLEDRPA